MLRPPIRRWMVPAIVYAATSLACAVAPDVPALRYVLGATWRWLWLLGPPALLVHQTGYLYLYAVGTTVVATGAWATHHWSRRNLEWSGIAACGTLALWVSFGLLVYIPNW